MDGTLVDSAASVLRAWRWTAEQLGLPFSAFQPYLHGIPADQVLAQRRAELATTMLARQAMDTDGVVAVPGGRVTGCSTVTCSWTRTSTCPT